LGRGPKLEDSRKVRFFINRACSIIKVYYWAEFAVFEVIKDNIPCKNNIMFNSMDSKIIKAFIEITYFQTMPIFFYKAKGSFNFCSEWF
jgi:hypothetical protein